MVTVIIVRSGGHPPSSDRRAMRGLQSPAAPFLVPRDLVLTAWSGIHFYVARPTQRISFFSVATAIHQDQKTGRWEWTNSGNIAV